MTMEAAELRAALDALGLKQTGPDGLDQFLGVGPVTVRRWVRDKEGTPVPNSVAMLLRLMIARRLKPTSVRMTYGDQHIPKPKPPVAVSRALKRRAMRRRELERES